MVVRWCFSGGVFVGAFEVMVWRCFSISMVVFLC